MELTEYIKIIRRWLWFILLSAFVVGSLVFITRTNQPRVFESSVKIIIGNITLNQDPNSAQIQVAFNLTRTYTEIINTSNVLNATIQALGLTLSEDELREMITTSTIPNTSIIAVTIRYTDPVLTADIANELAQQLIDQSPSNLTTVQETQLRIAQEQIAALTSSLEALRQRNSELDRQIAEATDQNIDDLNAERNLLTDQINQATSSIAIFSNTITEIQQRTNTLSVIEQAQIPTTPIGSSILTTSILGALVGAALAFGVVLLFEYLSDSFRTAEEVIQVMNLPVTGIISRLGSKDGYSDKLIINNLFSQSLEEYRGLRMNLLHGMQEDETKIIIVTSPIPTDGKTLTATNLALSIALAEQRVLLIDADLRRPKLHTILNIPNQVGLSTFLTLRSDLKDSRPNSADFSVERWKHCVQNPGIDNLRVLTTGISSNNPTELLGSNAMRHWIELLKESKEFDVVIFDTSPCLAVSDPVVLASAIQADVLLVLSANRVKRNLALKAKDRFVKVGVNITGIVLNDVKKGDESYYGYYGYYAPDAKEQSQSEAQSRE
jgi:polysaccharide biosynthesis transport protein